MVIKTLEQAQKDDGMKVFIYGESGSGKTSIARSFGRVLLISPESGHKSLFNPKALNKIDIVEPKSLNDFREAYQYLLDNKDKYDTVMIDSVTELSQMLKKDAEAKFNEKQALKMWGNIADTMITILKSFRDIQGINVVLTALEETVKSGFNDYAIPMFEGRKSGQLSPALFDIVARITKDKTGKRYIVVDAEDSVGKDRYNIVKNMEELDLFDPFGNILTRFNKHYLKEQLGSNYDNEKNNFYKQLENIKK